MGYPVFGLGLVLLLLSLAALKEGVGAEIELVTGLVTGGIYGRLRHPLYLSFAISMLALDLLFASLLGILVMLSGLMTTAVERFLPSAISREPRPLWASLLFGLGLVTAFTPIEEIIWRGYALTSLREHLSTWVAVVIASVAFGLMHWWGGVALIVESSIIGLLFSGLYLWRGNLVANIVCHFVSDFPLFLFMLFVA